MRIKHRQQSAAGFTILEVMVATTIFAIILLVLTAGVLSFTRSYFSSVNRSSTQTVARTVIDEITRAIEFSKAPPTIVSDGSGELKALCVDNVAYYVAVGQQIADIANVSKHQNKYGLIKRASSATGLCNAPLPNPVSSFAFSSSTDQELLVKNMRIAHLAVQLVDATTHMYSVSVKVAYGDDDLLGATSSTTNWSVVKCSGGAGSQYCAVSELSTTVQQRITGL